MDTNSYIAVVRMCRPDGSEGETTRLSALVRVVLRANKKLRVQV